MHELQQHINRYFTQLIGVVTRCHGDVLRFMGDALLIAWFVQVPGHRRATAAPRFLPAAGGGGSADAEADEGGAAEATTSHAEGRSQHRGSSRRKLRSRNPYIDAELGAGSHFDDSFADLEDFIVCKRGRRY